MMALLLNVVLAQLLVRRRKNNMKLIKDFGVRALLATIGGLGFYALLGFVLARYELDLPTIIAIIGIAQSPWMMALGFYFGTKVSELK